MCVFCPNDSVQENPSIKGERKFYPLTEIPTSTNSNTAHSRIFTPNPTFWNNKNVCQVTLSCCIDIWRAHCISLLWYKDRINGTQNSLVTGLLFYIYELLSSFIVKSKQLDILIGKCYPPQNAARWQKLHAKSVPQFSCLSFYDVCLSMKVFHQKTFIIKWHIPWK